MLTSTQTKTNNSKASQASAGELVSVVSSGKKPMQINAWWWHKLN